MDRRMFFFDFDGTLYSHTVKRVPDSAKEAIARLRREGHPVILATGRGFESVEMIRRELGFCPETMILFNGQIILDGGRVALERFIELPSMEEIIRIAKAGGFAFGGYGPDGLVVSAYSERVQTVWTEFTGPAPDLLGGTQDRPRLYHGHLYITEEEAALFEPFLADYVTNWSHRFLVNLIPREAGKSQAVRWCMERADVDPGDAYAFGDGYNDLDMLLAVGHGVAMGDARDDLKAAADYVTTSPEEDGIARALAHYGF